MVDSQWVLVSRALWDQFVLAESLSLGIINVVQPQGLYKFTREVSPLLSDVLDSSGQLHCYYYREK